MLERDDEGVKKLKKSQEGVVDVREVFLCIILTIDLFILAMKTTRCVAFYSHHQ